MQDLLKRLLQFVEVDGNAYVSFNLMYINRTNFTQVFVFVVTKV